MATPMFQILPIEESTPPSTPPFQPAATRRTPSSSRSNSWDSCLESSPLISFNESPPYSPTPPLNKLIGIPFSWEKTPGIPKNHRGSNKKESSRHHLLLPLPPAGTTTSSAKNQEEVSPKKKQTRLKRDPFLAALVECSKDDKINGTRSLVSDTFGLINMSISCKRSCAVSASIARLPLPRAKSQFLLHPRRHQSS